MYENNNMYEYLFNIVYNHANVIKLKNGLLLEKE